MLEVECYAGYKADERPRRLAVRTTRLSSSAWRTSEIREVLDQWYGPGYECFRVRADDGGIYVLRHDTTEDRWRLDSFRRR
jgi:hypothetical protein